MLVRGNVSSTVNTMVSAPVLLWDMVDKSISHHSTYFRLFFVRGSPDRPPHPEVRLHPSPLLASSPTSSQHDTETPSGFDASQAETGGKGHESTSRTVHRRVVLPAAIAGVRCRYRRANRLPPRSRGCASATRNDA
jgi:hypothetical protein